MLQQDHLHRIIDVQWGGAVEPQLQSAVSQINSPISNAQALSMSGWVRVRSGIPIFGNPASANYTVMVFGGHPDPSVIGYTDFSITANALGFTIRAVFVGVPTQAIVDGSLLFRAGYDDRGWFGEGPVLGQSQVGQTLTRVPNPVILNPPVVDADGRVHYWQVFGFHHAVCTGDTVPPPTGCFQIEVPTSVVGSQISVAPITGPYPYDTWHHFMWAINTAGKNPWGGELVEVYCFANALPALEYLPGFEGLKLAQLVGQPDGTQAGDGSGINLKGNAGFPIPGVEFGNGAFPVTNHIQLCDWQFYPRMINPNTEISNFIRIENGVRKRVRSRVAEDLYGEPVGSPPVKRPLWLFKGGGGSFHKSGPRSTDGEFLKIGVIKTVPPPPLWSPPA